jgi:hypothetical protein
MINRSQPKPLLGIFFFLITSIMALASSSSLTVKPASRYHPTSHSDVSYSNLPSNSHARLSSAVLSTFPWATDFLTQDLKSAITNPSCAVSIPFQVNMPSQYGRNGSRLSQKPFSGSKQSLTPSTAWRFRSYSVSWLKYRTT